MQREKPKPVKRVHHESQFTAPLLQPFCNATLDWRPQPPVQTESTVERDRHDIAI
jgi:hypothetical protein